MIDRFIGRRNGCNVFEFECPVCEGCGEIGIPDRIATKIILHGCGAAFIQQPPIGLFDKPHLVFVGPEIPQA